MDLKEAGKAEPTEWCAPGERRPVRTGVVGFVKRRFVNPRLADPTYRMGVISPDVPKRELASTI